MNGKTSRTYYKETTNIYCRKTCDVSIEKKKLIRLRPVIDKDAC